MPVTIDQFLNDLAETGLLSDEQLAALEDRAGEDRQRLADKLAKQLVQEGQLTRHQAAALYQGKAYKLAFGEYRVIDQLGKGGMGVVLRAEHRRMKRKVAIKVLPEHAMEKPGAVDRFYREVEAAAKLSHPNIVTAYDAGEHRGMHYLVMELVEGQDLAELVKARGPLPVEQAVDCVVQAARGLGYAHERGVVHRDIKPSNLLLAQEGTVKILDMGLARMLDAGPGETQNYEAGQLTDTGQMMGTVDFMAPEQAEDTRTADHRADIYSLGCTLYRILTDESPYGGDTIMRKLLAHRDAPVPSLRAARPEVSEALDAAFQKMVAKRPADRQQSMDEVIADLEASTAPAKAPPKPAERESSSDAALSGFLAQLDTGSSGIGSRERKGKTGAAEKAALRTKQKADSATNETLDHRPAEVEQDTGDDVFSSRTRAGSQITGGSGSQEAAPRKSTTSGVSKAADAPVPKPAPAAASPETKSTKPRRSRRADQKRLLYAYAACGAGVLLVGAFALIFAFSRGGDPPAGPDEKQSGEQDGKPPVAAAQDQPPPLAKAPFDADEAIRHQQAWAEYLGVPVERDITLPGGERLTMVLIPPGEFLMGSTDEEQAKALEEAKAAKDQWAIDRIPSEGPQHRVRITRPFYLGKYEVTQAQWQSAMGSNPSRFKDNPSHPVEQVSWDDIQPFLAKLNGSPSADKMKFALPSETHWEYACRSGTATPYYGGEGENVLRQYGWSNANSGGKTHPVGALKPNSFGLYDMHGNVWEWCADWYAGDYYAKAPADDPTGPSAGSRRVIRGGSWDNHPRNCRSANRLNHSPDYRNNRLGFRLAASLDDVAPATLPRIPAAKADEFTPGGKEIDLLANLDPMDAAIKGEWSKDTEGVLSTTLKPGEGDAYAAIKLADDAPDSYDLELEFRYRNAPHQSLFYLTLPVAGRTVQIRKSTGRPVAGPNDGPYGGLGRNAPAVKIREHPQRWLTKKYEGQWRRFAVRVTDGEVVKIAVFLNDQLFASWEGPRSGMHGKANGVGLHLFSLRSDLIAPDGFTLDVRNIRIRP